MIEGCLNRLPTGRPYSTPVVDVKIASAIVHRNIVVAVTRQTTKLRILIKSIASCSVRNQRKEILIAQIVDPGPGGFGLFNHILPSLVVKMSKSHLCVYYLVLLDRKSTRLNSSHVRISYAVFCLKKKIIARPATPTTQARDPGRPKNGHTRSSGIFTKLYLVHLCIGATCSQQARMGFRLHHTRYF